MGWPFSGKTVVSTSVQTVPLVNEKPKNRIAEAIRLASSRNEDLTDTIKYQTLTGYKRDLINCYNYAKSSYIYGLPTATSAEEFIPIVPIRYNDKNTNDDKTSELYITTKNLLRTTKINLDDFTDQVTKKYNSKNELVNIADLDKISDIFVIYGINIYSDTQEEKEMLFKLFSSLESIAGTKETFDTALADEVLFTPSTLLINEETFDYDLIYNYVTVTEIEGKVSERDTYTVTFSINGTHTYVPDGDLEEELEYLLDYVTIRHQTTLSTYTEIVIHGLYIYHMVKTVSGGKIHPVNLVTFTEGLELTPEHKNFIIPLRHLDIVDLLTSEGDSIISSSKHLLIYASDSQYLKWYQTGAFLNLLQLTLRVISLVSLIGDSTGSTAQVLLEIGKAIVKQYAFEAILTELFLKFGDNDLAKVILAFAAIYISYNSLDEAALTKLSTAEKLLRLTSSTSSVLKTYTKSQYSVLEQEYEDFRKDKEALETEIEEAQDILNVGNRLNPSAAINASTYAYEDPNDFYTRTLNTAPGQLVFDQLHNYVDNNLNLDYIR